MSAFRQAFWCVFLGVGEGGGILISADGDRYPVEHKVLFLAVVS
jgi:hypothetical protein